MTRARQVRISLRLRAKRPQLSALYPVWRPRVGARMVEGSPLIGGLFVRTGAGVNRYVTPVRAAVTLASLARRTAAHSYLGSVRGAHDDERR